MQQCRSLTCFALLYLLTLSIAFSEENTKPTSLTVYDVTDLETKYGRQSYNYESESFDEWGLTVSNVSSIDEALARALANLSAKTMWIRGIESIEPPALMALANFPGKLLISSKNHLQISSATQTALNSAPCPSLIIGNAWLRHTGGFMQQFGRPATRLGFDSNINHMDDLRRYLKTGNNVLLLTNTFTDDPNLAEAIEWLPHETIDASLLPTGLLNICLSEGDDDSSFTARAVQLRQIIRRASKGNLCFGGIESLNAELVKKISQLECKNMSLNSLKTIEPVVAKGLINSKCVTLTLSGIEELEAATAEALAKSDLNLSFPSLLSLTNENSFALSKARGKLSLDGITSITADAAHALSNYGGDLSLRRIEEIEPEAASELGSAGCKTLNLSSLVVNEETASKLGEFSGEKMVLSAASDASAAAKLVEIKHDLEIVGAISDQVIRELAKFKGDSLTLSPSDNSDWLAISHDTFDELSKFGGKKLVLNNIYELDARATKSLAALECNVEIKGHSLWKDEVYELFLTVDDTEAKLRFVSEITPSFAKRLTELEIFSLNLNCLKKIDYATAKGLSNFSGPILLENVSVSPLENNGKSGLIRVEDSMTSTYYPCTTIDQKTASLLRGWNEVIALPFVKLIDKETAAELAKIRGYLYLPNLETIDDEVLDELKKFQGKGICLQGITSINKQIAEFLCKMHCLLWWDQGLFLKSYRLTAPNPPFSPSQEIQLVNLEELDSESARALANSSSHLSFGLICGGTGGHNGGHWSVQKGLSKLEPEVARELAKSDNWLRFWNLDSLTKESAAALSEYDGRYLSFYMADDPEIPEELFESASQSLEFIGLTKLDARTAEGMSRFRGRLNLSSVTAIDQLTARQLANSRGVITLGLHELNKDVTAEFLKSEGSFSFLQLQRIEPAALTLIRNVEDLNLFLPTKFVRRSNESFTSKDSISLAQARELASRKAKWLRLSSLKELSPEIATILAGARQEYLYLSGVTQITPEAAQEIAKFKGDRLYMQGLTNMDKDVAQALSTYAGRLYLNRSIELDEQSKSVLENNGNLLLSSHNR